MSVGPQPSNRCQPRLWQTLIAPQNLNQCHRKSTQGGVDAAHDLNLVHALLDAEHRNLRDCVASELIRLVETYRKTSFPFPDFPDPDHARSAFRVGLFAPPAQGSWADVDAQQGRLDGRSGQGVGRAARRKSVAHSRVMPHGASGILRLSSRGSWLKSASHPSLATPAACRTKKIALPDW